MNTLIIDGANDAAFGHDVAHDQAVFAGLGFEADIVEAAGVPEDHEIAAGDIFGVRVAWPLGDLGLQGVLRNAPGATKFDGFDNLAIETRRSRSEEHTSEL